MTIYIKFPVNCKAQSRRSISGAIGTVTLTTAEAAT